MDKSTRWRTIFLALILAGSIATLMPTFLPRDSLPVWFTQVFDRQINLGLDLQGGQHIVYSIDLNKAVDDKASELKRDIEAKLSESSLTGTVTTPSVAIGALAIHLGSAEDKARIDSKFLSDYDEFVVSRSCGANEGDHTVCLRVSSEYADSIKKAALTQAVNTIRSRIDEKGIAEPKVVTKGDQIIVELPGLNKESRDRITDLIKRTAKLEFKMVADADPWMQSLYRHVEQGDPDATAAKITGDTDTWGHDDSGKRFTDYYLRTDEAERNEFLTVDEAKQYDVIGKCDVERPGADGRVPCGLPGRFILERYLKSLAAKDPAFAVPDAFQIGYELVRPEEDDESGSKPHWRTYYLHRAVELTGSGVQDSYVFFDQTTNRPQVLIDFNRHGGRRFGDLTAGNIGKKMAIILDDKVTSAPTIQSAIRGGRSTITMGGSDPAKVQAEADDLVAVLKTGSLPAPLKQESSSEVGPMLGRDAVAKAQLSFGLGAALVILMMIWFYRVSGTISVIAMTLNIVLMLAVMALFGATLSLPGIAALVLAVGLAVDGNIIIYERVREELTNGKSVRGAIDTGFARAFTTVFDGHLTTAAAGWVLYEYGSGPIQGFAVMLLIGIGTTLFTTIWCTRLFFDYYLGRGRKEFISI